VRLGSTWSRLSLNSTPTCLIWSPSKEICLFSGALMPVPPSIC